MLQPKDDLAAQRVAALYEEPDAGLGGSPRERMSGTDGFPITRSIRVRGGSGRRGCTRATHTGFQFRRDRNSHHAALGCQAHSSTVARRRDQERHVAAIVACTLACIPRTRAGVLYLDIGNQIGNHVNASKKGWHLQ